MFNATNTAGTAAGTAETAGGLFSVTTSPTLLNLDLQHQYQYRSIH